MGAMGMAMMANNVSLDVRVCDVCEGSGRRVVMARYPLPFGYGWRVVREQHPCTKCWQSGYVVRLSGGAA